MDSNEETRKIHVNDPSQLLEAKEEIYVSSRQHSNNHGGSSHVNDSWTCRYCGWVYPNPRPSAKHRRHHKKHCGKLKELVVEVNFQKGGSSDDTSSGEEEKEHIQDHFPVVEAPNLSDCKKGSYLRKSAEDHGSISLQSTSESKDGPTATDGKISGLYSGGELKHTVSPLQQSAHGCRLGQAIEPDIQTADPCNSKEVGNLQIKEATLNRDAVESDIIDLSCLLETSHKKSSKVMSPEPLLAISHVKGEMMHDFHVPKVVEPDHVTLPPAKVLDSPCTSISETKGTVTFPDPLEETFLINVTPVSISSSSEPINKFKRTPVEDTVEASTKHQLSSSAKAPSSTIPREVESLQNIDGPVQFSTFSGFPKAETGPKENVIVDSFAETLQMDSQHRMKSIPLESESEASVNNPITISLMNTTDLNISDSLKEIDLFLNSTEKEIPVEAINEWEGLQNQGTCANRTSSGSIDIVNTDEGELPAKGKSIIVTSSSNSDRTSHELPLYSENLNTSQTGLQTKEVSSLPAEDNTVTDVISGMPKCPEASCLSDDSAIQPSCPAKVSDGEKTSELGVSLNDLEKAVTSAQKFHPEEKPTDDVNSKGLFLDDKPTISVSSSGPEATTLALPTGEVSETVDVLTTAKDFHSSGFHKQNDSNGAAIVDKDAEVKAADGDSVVKEFRNWEVKDNASFRRDSGSYDLAADQIDNVKKAESTDDTLSTTKNLERNLNEPGIENKDEESKASVVDFVLEESQKWEGKDNTSFGMDSRPCDLGAGEVGNSEKVDSSADILSTAKDPDSLSLHKASSLSEPAFVIKDAKVKATDADPLLEESQNWEIKDNALSGKGFAPHILAANEMASFGKTEFKGIMFTGKDVDLASLHKESNSNESAIVHKDAKAKDANADSVPEESQKWEAKDNTTSGKDSRFHSLCADEMDDFTKAEFASNISSTAKDPYLSSRHELSTLNDPAFVNKEAKIKYTKDSALEESHKWEDEDNTSSGRDFQPDNLGVDKIDSSEKAKNTAVISSTANDPESSSLRDERDLNYPALNKDAELGVTYSDSVLKESQKVETSSGREFGPHSLDSDEMDSFKRAESEFSAFSEFASSSRKLSDSPEIFEDAQDVFDGYSICDGMEMDESLDGSHQDTHAYIEEVQACRRPSG
ncbi:hypothetical protein KP509_19G030100 [Ceratopteris richardii]|nr:hypothetical protein KP509_19G030100 [Ceratopteris richardii]